MQHQARSRLVGGAKRRSNVLRFLATCEEEEIAEFVQLNLGSFQNLPGTARGKSYFKFFRHNVYKNVLSTQVYANLT